jgi:hypothetical protein
MQAPNNILALQELVSVVQDIRRMMKRREQTLATGKTSRLWLDGLWNRNVATLLGNSEISLTFDFGWKLSVRSDRKVLISSDSLDSSLIGK